MPETPRNNNEKPETIDGLPPLTFERFRYKPGEPDIHKRLPFNNFYFYFYTGKDAELSPVDMYLQKSWFRDFAREHPEVLQEMQEAMSKALQEATDKARLFELISEPLYKAYLVARRHATDTELFS